MYLSFRIICVVIITVTASACSFLRFPGAYKVVIQQGNFIEEEMVEQLEVGMNREQVLFIMGSPMIADTFNADRWDYFFNVKRGGKVLTNYHFRVMFEEGRLASWEGDYRKKNQTMDSTTGGTDPKLAEQVNEEEKKEKPADKNPEGEPSEGESVKDESAEDEPVKESDETETI